MANWSSIVEVLSVDPGLWGSINFSFRPKLGEVEPKG